MKWVDINLPWDAPRDHEYRTEFHKKNEEFIRYVWAKRKEAGEPPQPDFADGPSAYKKIDEVTSRAPELSELTRIDDDEFLAKIEGKYAGDTEVIALARYRNKSRKVWKLEQEWNETDPRFIEYKRLHAEFTAWEKSLSFRNHPMCKANVYLEVRRPDGALSKMLMGNVNEVGGTCDDCADINADDVIVRAFDLTDIINAAINRAPACRRCGADLSAPDHATGCPEPY